MSLPDVSLRFDSDAPLSSFFDVEAASLPDPEVTPGPVEALVAARGETVILVRCLTPEFDDYDSFDPAASSWDLRLVKALISSPSEKEARTLAGRGIDATVRATVPSTCAVQADRPGQPDHVVRVPGATSLSVDRVDGVWTVAIGGEEYAVSLGSGGVLLVALPRTAYCDLVVREVRRDRHPFTGVTKLSVYLQEVVG